MTENERNSGINIVKHYFNGILFQWKMLHFLFCPFSMTLMFSLWTDFWKFFLFQVSYFSPNQFSISVFSIAPNVNYFYFPANWKVDFHFFFFLFLITNVINSFKKKKSTLQATECSVAFALFRCSH